MKPLLLLLLALQFDVGIKAGQKIPPFRLVDQNGTPRDFNSVKGSKGTVLLFFRSADW